MKFEEIQKHLKGVPYIGANQAKILYDFVLEKQPDECLELGFAYGASACYTAAALDELGKGHLTAVDIVSGQEWQKPAIEELLAKTGLGSYVSIYRENTSYTWFLKKKIEENLQSEGIYDFCYIDGPKNWTIDGCAFFLADKLLKQDGWILFDDFDWTYNAANEWAIQKLEETGVMVGLMGQEERNVAHVELIFRLLVMEHPNYSDFKIQDNSWGWAHKVASAEKTLVHEETGDLRTKIRRTFGV